MAVMMTTFGCTNFCCTNFCCTSVSDSVLDTFTKFSVHFDNFRIVSKRYSVLIRNPHSVLLQVRAASIARGVDYCTHLWQLHTATGGLGCVLGGRPVNTANVLPARTFQVPENTQYCFWSCVVFKFTYNSISTPY